MDSYTNRHSLRHKLQFQIFEPVSDVNTAELTFFTLMVEVETWPLQVSSQSYTHGVLLDCPAPLGLVLTDALKEAFVEGSTWLVQLLLVAVVLDVSHMNVAIEVGGF